MVLIATDVAAEGLNLQSARAIVHFDLPWNPAKLVQRAGRVDRLGGRREIQEVLMRLHPDIDAALLLTRRLEVKRCAAAQILAPSPQALFAALEMHPTLRSPPTDIWVWEGRHPTWFLVLGDVILEVRDDTPRPARLEQLLELLPARVSPLRDGERPLWVPRVTRVTNTWLVRHAAWELNRMHSGGRGLLVRAMLQLSAELERAGAEGTPATQALSALACKPTSGGERWMRDASEGLQAMAHSDRIALADRVSSSLARALHTTPSAVALVPRSMLPPE